MRASFLVIKDTLIRLFIFGIWLLTNTFTEMLRMTSFATLMKDYITVRDLQYRYTRHPCHLRYFHIYLQNIKLLRLSCPFLELSHDGINVWEACPPLLPCCQLFRIADEKHLMFFAKSIYIKVLNVKSAYLSEQFLLTLDPDPFFREFEPEIQTKISDTKQFKSYS